MIRNKRQLLHAEKRLAEIGLEIAEIREHYEGFEEEIYVTPLANTAAELRAEIAEYNALVNSTLPDAVDGVLKKPTLLDNIGELLTKLRIAAGLSQAEIAEMLGWEQPNLSRFESANYGSQSVAKIIEYADSLGVWLYVVPKLEELSQDEDLTTIYTSDASGYQASSGLDNFLGLSFKADREGRIMPSGVFQYPNKNSDLADFDSARYSKDLAQQSYGVFWSQANTFAGTTKNPQGLSRKQISADAFQNYFKQKEESSLLEDTLV